VPTHRTIENRACLLARPVIQVVFVESGRVRAFVFDLEPLKRERVHQFIESIQALLHPFDCSLGVMLAIGITPGKVRHPIDWGGLGFSFITMKSWIHGQILPRNDYPFHRHELRPA
jgi:hypothetical protein